MPPTITADLKRRLQDEIPYLRLEIRKVYSELDKQWHLYGADVPIEFTMDTEQLGAYAPAINGKPEHFRFSLLFIGYLETGSLHRQDKLDLYKHEYAHYMQFHIDIPKEHQWQPGLHGSAWKYCCSLIGAAPTEHYHKNEGTRSHDYDKALKNPWKNKHTALLDIAHRKKEAEDQKNREIRYQIGDTAVHPKFGEGIIEAVEQLQGSVRLHIRFGNELKKIDQKWLERSKYK